MTKTRTSKAGSDITRLVRGPPSESREQQLLATIEQQIIPRLMIAQGPEVVTAVCGEGRPPPTLQELEEIGRMAIAQETRRLIDHLSRLASEGLSFQDLLLEVIAPAADWLGDSWKEDTITFADVTTGAGVLERVAVALGEGSDPPLRRGDLIVLTAAQGEQHMLPIHLLGEALRQEGWAVHVDSRIQQEELEELVANDRVAAVGISCKDPERLGYFPDLVAGVRACSLNQDIAFYLGGSNELEQLAPTYGAVYCECFDDFLEAVASLRPPIGHQ